MITKSPFLVYRLFISPLLTEEIIDSLDVNTPDIDKKGNPLRLTRHHDKSEKILFDRLQVIIPEIEKHYGIHYRGTEHLMFEWYPQGSRGELRSENSDYLRKKWVRTKDRDISAVLFLSDYNDKVPFESEFEVYGGKLEFPQHQFSFNPNRGTLIIFPSVPHFINATSTILAGDLFQVRIHTAASVPFLYDPKKFPGDFREWFKGDIGA